MPATYNDQFFVIDPYAPPPVGTAMNFVLYDLTDQNDDDDIDRFDGDSVDGFDVTASYPGDTVTINVPGIGNVTYTGITFYLADGREVFTPTDGQVLQNGTLVSTTWVSGQGPLDVVDLGPVCFTPGTMILTSQGPRPVEALRPGELIPTRDNGLQPLLGVCRERYNASGAAAPVLIRRMALGNEDDLLVSQQHRILITDWRAELYSGEPEVLVAAKHLADGDAIAIRPGGSVDYLHLRFKHHEIVTSSGIPSESLFPESLALVKAGTNHRATVLDASSLVRPVLRSYEGAAFGAS